MPKILSEKEKEISKQKRKEYLKQYSKLHSKDYYKNHKETILNRQRNNREKKKGSLIRNYEKVNLNKMSEIERKTYYREKMKEYRLRKKLQNLTKNNI